MIYRVVSFSRLTKLIANLRDFVGNPESRRKNGIESRTETRRFSIRTLVRETKIRDVRLTQDLEEGAEVLPFGVKLNKRDRVER